MPLDLQEFRSQFQDGGARPSLFEMQINRGTGSSPSAQFYIRATEIPGLTVNQIVQKFAGRELKFAAQPTFTNLTVTVLNDEKFTVRRFLEGWLNDINGRVTNVRAPQAATEVGYQGTGRITQFGKAGGELAVYEFVGLFPVNLAPIPLDWSNDGVIEEYTIEFAYQYWTPLVGISRSFAPQ
jgi:hypothetical protein